MNSLSAENYFKKGLTALVDLNHEDAAVFFKRAIELDGQRNKLRPDMRYLSYYGLSLARAGLSTSTAIEACRKAVRNHESDPVLWLNLGRVYLIAGKHVHAMSSFERGLALAPDNPILRRELKRIDRRSPPVLGRVSRDNPVNRVLGRVRASVQRRHQDAPIHRSAESIR